jgi:hypothetical protein
MEATAGARSHWQTWLLGFLLVVVTFAAGALYISGETHVRKVEAQAATERARIESQAAAEREALLARASTARATLATDLLKMNALPLSWAVRQALQDKDYREIALYFQQLVGLSRVRRAALVLSDGIIKVASDKKLEGKAAAEAFAGASLVDDGPIVRPRDEHMLEAIVPIMGLNSRLGTVIVHYELGENVSAAPSTRP